MIVSINLEKIASNVKFISRLCRQSGLQVVWVTKGCHSHPAILEVLESSDAEIVADSRLDNFARISENISGKRMMLGLPSILRSSEIVRQTDICLISSTDHARLLSEKASAAGLQLQVILMVDMGNLREGLMPDMAGETITAINRIPRIDLVGLGTAIGCFAGFRVNEQQLLRFSDCCQRIQRDTGMAFPVISLGSGTMALPLLMKGGLPVEINQIRVGAAYLVGEQPPTRTAIEGLHQDAFRIRAQVVESIRKPSIPDGKIGIDAFGHNVIFADQGPRRKALLDLGQLDTDVYDLTPIMEGIQIIGATSTYTVCDVMDAPVRIETGMELEFRMGYSAVSRSLASPYPRQVVYPNGLQKGRQESHGK
jgi:ornithine racemase